MIPSVSRLPEARQQGEKAQRLKCAVAITAAGHRALLIAMGYKPADIVWVPVVRLPWLDEKPRAQR